MLEYLISDDIVNLEDRIAVGVSGGADSMLLLWALLDKQKLAKFKIHVVHVNHHLRGEESDSDAKFIKDFCEKKHIDYTIVDVDVNKLKQEKKYTLEESARIARFDAFAKIMKKERLNKLFLAHHKNDQVETILMHIFRGSGVSGAVGIKDDGKIFRPLLDLSKLEILELAKQHGIKFVCDSTNANSDYSRNYLRNIVIPSIEKIYPNVVDAIFEFGKKCKHVQDYIENDVKSDYFEENNDYVLIKDEVFEKNKVLAFECIKTAFKKLKIFSDIEKKHLEMVFKLFKLEVNKSVDLPHGMQARRAYAGVKLYKKRITKTKNLDLQFVIGELDFPGYGKIKTSIVSPSDVVYGEGSLFVDIAKVSNEAVWRTRKIGDIFAKLGTGSKKLNDYFTDKKIDFEKRDNIPILAISKNILVVAENDVSELAKIDGKTEQIVKIEFYPNIIRWQSHSNLIILLVERGYV